MKILVVCQYYYPEPFRITDICEEWVKQGYEVTVVTGLPNYPMGKIYEGYKDKKWQDEIINGVKVHRCFEIGRRNGVIFRFLNYYSFAWSSKKYLKKLKENFDVIFVNQLSPIMMANGALAYKKKNANAKLMLYCLDLWPESLVAGGIQKGSLLYKHYHKVSKTIYNSADMVLITSKTFRRYLIEELGVNEENIRYLPQYAEEIFSADTCRKTPDGQIDLLFAGNIGKAQSLETIIKAAKETQDIQNLHWHIVGDGSDLERCKSLAAQLGVESITFYGRKPLEDMPLYYKNADAMLVTLIDEEALSLTLPGKVQTYMAAGKPIIAAINGETANVIKEAECGYCGQAEDYFCLAENVRRFCREYAQGKNNEMGTNAKNFYINNYSKSVFFENIMALM